MEVVFRCNKPAPPFFVQQLGMFTCSIISPAAMKKYGSEIRIRPVGTGPFKFVKWDSDREIHLERNQPLFTEVQEFLVDGPGTARVRVRIGGGNAMPLRFWNVSLLREDRWERHDGQWWIVTESG